MRLLLIDFYRVVVDIETVENIFSTKNSKYFFDSWLSKKKPLILVTND